MTIIVVSHVSMWVYGVWHHLWPRKDLENMKPICSGGIVPTSCNDTRHALFQGLIFKCVTRFTYLSSLNIWQTFYTTDSFPSVQPKTPCDTAQDAPGQSEVSIEDCPGIEMDGTKWFYGLHVRSKSLSLLMGRCNLWKLYHGKIKTCLRWCYVFHSYMTRVYQSPWPQGLSWWPSNPWNRMYCKICIYCFANGLCMLQLLQISSRTNEACTSTISFFLLAGQLVHVTWSCSFIIGWWEVKDLYMILELGRSPLCTVKRETSWWKLRNTKFGSWKRSNSKKQGRGPPGTQAPPGQVPGDTAKERTSQPTTWSKASTLRLYTPDCLMP